MWNGGLAELSRHRNCAARVTERYEPRRETVALRTLHTGHSISKHMPHDAQGPFFVGTCTLVSSQNSYSSSLQPWNIIAPVLLAAAAGNLPGPAPRFDKWQVTGPGGAAR